MTSLRERFPAPALMGVVNVTPDSFSDGGVFFDHTDAVAEALRQRDAGAAIIDIGGESTRPGSDPISVQEELGRVLGVIERVRALSDTPLSIDTSKAEVAVEALTAGAGFINDVTALGDPAMAAVVAGRGCDICLMHMLGTPRTMQIDPVYDDVVREVADFLSDRVELAVSAGVARDHICVDPGIGFGKTAAHNVALIAGIDQLEAATGCAVLIGVSRKSFLGRVIGDAARDRTVVSVTAALAAADRGAWMLRVHDVAAHQEALAVRRAISIAVAR
jgi:dihydropteroate synthase